MAEGMSQLESDVISWTVVGHEARIQAADLARHLDAAVVTDDGTLGADANHLRAWTALGNAQTSWIGVAEDDAIPVPGFREQLAAALLHAPTPVVSLYLGRTRPKRWQDRISHALIAADRADACWLTGTHILHAVAVIMRTELHEDWMDFARTNTRPIDERLTAWCLVRGHDVAYTWPSLVDHADGPTLIDHTGQPTGPRVAWRTGTRTHWTEKAVKL